MRIRFVSVCVVISMLVALSACGQESSGGGGNQVSYKEVKSMVIDILGSEEAQKALEKASTAQYGESTLQMKSMTPQDQEEVRIAVKDVLTSEGYETVLKKLMVDPKFAGEFAKAVSKDNKQIHKDLMKDPTYQKELVDMFKTQEMQKIMTDSMKTPDVRKLVNSSVTEAMQNPLFKLEIMKLLQVVVKEELTPDTESKGKKDEQSGGEEQQSGGEEGGSGEEGGGEGGDGGGQ
ncbi:spore germination lipoprotein GerD [Cohnella sp. GCM10027633]|uniref:spore germination lipoprotein GerD n=1 Tax=unclassified Cohnella TaxID=2636738 RepID=UPI00362B12ED